MDYVTVKLHADTRRLLRLIAAQTGEQMVQVMHRLCEREWDSIRDQSTPDTTPDGSGVQEKDAPFEAS